MVDTYFIAEVGLNHNGDIELAKKLVETAIECKSDAIKFQKRNVNQMATRDILDKPFTNFPSFGSTYREIREHLELTFNEYKELIDLCKGRIDFIVTPFDIQSLEFLDKLDIDALKIASHNMTDIPLIEEIAKRQLPVYMSTGMCSMSDIELSVDILDPNKERIIGSENPLCIMHCISQYPSPAKYANLRMVSILRDKYPNHLIGFSDHQNGFHLPPAALSLGATVFEKHFTLNHTFEGFDHVFSLEPGALKKCIRNIRETADALEYHEKMPMEYEMNAFNDYKRSVVSTRNIPKGTVITRDMLTTKAPNRGLSPKLIPSIVGMTASKDIEEDTHITYDVIES